MKIILIGGKAQNGKDTTAEMLKADLIARGNKVLITHFGDTVKFVCTNYFGWNGLKDDAGRELLQQVGTNMVREKFPTFWTDFVKELMIAFDGMWDYVIIPDCRFKNELYAFIKDPAFDSVFIKVTRPNFKSPLTIEQQRHPSETDLDDVTDGIQLINDGSKPDLFQKIKELLDNNDIFKKG